MKKPPHYAGLLWTFWLTLTIAIGTAIASAVMDPDRRDFFGGTYIDASVVAAKSSLAALSNVALVVAAVAAIAAAVLAGVKQMLEQVSAAGHVVPEVPGDAGETGDAPASPAESGLAHTLPTPEPETPVSKRAAQGPSVP